MVFPARSTPCTPATPRRPGYDPSVRTPQIQTFKPEEYRQRLDGVRSRIAALGADVLLVNTPENIFYLTGYQTPGYYWYQALIVPVDRDPVFIPPPHEASLPPVYSWVASFFNSI